MSTAELSIRDELAAALKSSQAVPETEVETPETETAVETPVVEAKETPAQERARDEKGRFAAKTDTAESAAPVVDRTSDAAAREPGKGKTDASAQPANAANAHSTDAASASASALAPPNGWPAEAKAKWHELPPEIHAAVQKREQDIAKFTSTRDEHASFGRDVYRVVQPYLAQIAAEGGTPVTAVQSMLNTAYVLRTGSPQQKTDILLKVAKEYGIELGAAKPGAPPTNTDQGYATLQSEIAALKNELSQFKTAGVTQLQSEVEAEIAAFAADPKHPHYESVKGHMSALIGQGLAKDLQDAYDQAVWARPDTRATLEAQRRADEEQKRRADAKAKAEAARKKNVSLTGGPGNTANASAPEGRSIRDELLAAHAASSGAV